MRGLWVAVLGAGLMVLGGAWAQAQTASANTTQRMCKADVKAQRKTQKAEAKAARNNAKSAEQEIRAQERKAGNGPQKEQALAVVLTPPPM
jgi:Flp pilus assembly protein TadB